MSCIITCHPHQKNHLISSFRPESFRRMALHKLLCRKLSYYVDGGKLQDGFENQEIFTTKLDIWVWETTSSPATSIVVQYQWIDSMNRLNRFWKHKLRSYTYLKIWQAVLQSGGWQFAPGAARPKGAERGLVATCHWWMTGCLVFVLLLLVSFPGVRTCQHQLVSPVIVWHRRLVIDGVWPELQSWYIWQICSVVIEHMTAMATPSVLKKCTTDGKLFITYLDISNTIQLFPLFCVVFKAFSTMWATKKKTRTFQYTCSLVRILISSCIGLRKITHITG